MTNGCFVCYVNNLRNLEWLKQNGLTEALAGIGEVEAGFEVIVSGGEVEGVSIGDKFTRRPQRSGICARAGLHINLRDDLARGVEHMDEDSVIRVEAGERLPMECECRLCAGSEGVTVKRYSLAKGRCCSDDSFGSSKCSGNRKHIESGESRLSVAFDIHDEISRASGNVGRQVEIVEIGHELVKRPLREWESVVDGVAYIERGVVERDGERRIRKREVSGLPMKREAEAFALARGERGEGITEKGQIGRGREGPRGRSQRSVESHIIAWSGRGAGGQNNVGDGINFPRKSTVGIEMGDGDAR